MGKAFEVILDKRQVEEVRRTLRAIPNGFPRVASRAINKTATTIRSRMAKRLSRETGIQQKAVRKQIWILKARMDFLSALISLKGKAIPLIDLGARQTRKGVTYRAGKGQRKLISHAWIATMPSGHTGAYTRKGPPRLPIHELFGTSILSAYVGEVDAQIRAEAGGLLEHYIDQEIKRLLEKRRAAA